MKNIANTCTTGGAAGSGSGLRPELVGGQSRPAPRPADKPRVCACQGWPLIPRGICDGMKSPEASSKQSGPATQLYALQTTHSSSSTIANEVYTAVLIIYASYCGLLCFLCILLIIRVIPSIKNVFQPKPHDLKYISTEAVENTPHRKRHTSRTKHVQRIGHTFEDSLYLQQYFWYDCQITSTHSVTRNTLHTRKV